MGKPKTASEIAEAVAAYMCPYCGERFTASQIKGGLIPYHDYPRPFRSCCLGSKQHPRDANDKRPLWKDENL